MTVGKVLLGVAGCTVLLGLSVAGAAWYVWHSRGATWFAGLKETRTQGVQAGADLDENGCLAAAIQKHRTGPLDFGSSLRDGLWFRGCLDGSRLVLDFCRDVPQHDEILRTSVWIVGRCQALGFTDSYCSPLFQRLSEYCVSPERAAKRK